jgi:hypothetical protein
MNINTEEMLKSNAFKNIDPELLQLLTNLMAKLQDKSVSEATPIVIKFMTTLPKHLTITKPQEEAMLKEVMKNLSPADQSKINAMLKLSGATKR